jgi:hypothetical protein
MVRWRTFKIDQRKQAQLQLLQNSSEVEIIRTNVRHDPSKHLRNKERGETCSIEA